MIKCIAKCSKGYNRCCHACELKEFCKDACKTKPGDCSFVEDRRELRSKERELKADKRFMRLYIIGFVAFLALLFTLLVVIGNQNTIMEKQQQTYGAVVNLQTDLQAELYDIGPDFFDDVVTPPDEIEPIATFQLTPEEFALVCRVVMSESGDQGLQAQMAVAQTIYDRMNDWGYSLNEAICPGVYSTKDNGEPTDSVKLAVANVFEGGMRVYEGGTYQFHDDTVLPYWTEGKIARGSIGRLSFYGGYAD